MQPAAPANKYQLLVCFRDSTVVLTQLLHTATVACHTLFCWWRHTQVGLHVGLVCLTYLDSTQPQHTFRQNTNRVAPSPLYRIKLQNKEKYL